MSITVDKPQRHLMVAEASVCGCKSHTLYTYIVAAPAHTWGAEYAGWEYSGVHSCGKNCSGDFLDGHYLGSSTSPVYQKIKRTHPEWLNLTGITNFISCDELDRAEMELVTWEYVNRTDTFNKTPGGGRINNPWVTRCDKCDGTIASHRKQCPRYASPPLCSECSVKNGHKKTCSLYKVTPCQECESIKSHLPVCSKYTVVDECFECHGGRGTHKRICSKFSIAVCQECESLSTAHKLSCSQSSGRKDCELCGGVRGGHRKFCLKNGKKENTCERCAGLDGKHKKECVLFTYKTFCQECGSLGNNSHSAKCSNFVIRKQCDECQTRSGAHRNGCSKKPPTKLCKECESPLNAHKKICSLRKPPRCGQCRTELPQHTSNCPRHAKGPSS